MAPPFTTSLPFNLLERYGRASQGCPLSLPGFATNTAYGSSLYREALGGLHEQADRGLSVYVHVPFCHVRCLFCGCDTTVTHSEERVDRYLDALETEIRLATELAGRKRHLDQLHIGGGTPNHLSEPQLARLMEIIERHFTLTPDTRTSIECNPRRASAAQLDLIHGLGFRCISFGVQDLNLMVQRAIGRVQSMGMVRDVFMTARETGFETISLDLVYGLPFQTEASFQETLERIIELGPDRVSCYSYNHDPVRRPHQHAIDASHLPSQEERVALFQETVKTFAAAGYRWVGLDVFAREGDELLRAQEEGRLYRNAIGYAPLPAKPVLAFGPSGVGEIGGALFRNDPNLVSWQRRLASNELPIAVGRRLSEMDRKRREALVYLMCNMRLPASSLDVLEQERELLARDTSHGWLEVTENGIRVTPEGRYLLHDLCVERDASVDWGSAQWRLTSVS